MRCFASLILVGTLVTSAFCTLQAIAADAASNPVRKPYGIEKRVPWTTSRIHGTPEPPSPYQTAVAFPQIKFFEPLEAQMVPGTNRLCVAERPGKIFTFAVDPKTSEKRLLVDAAKVVYSLAFHPKFQQNGFVFVTEEVSRGKDKPSDIHVVRYTVRPPSSLQADPQSRKIIIEWAGEGHRGGCLRFGPDGLLYIVVGDGSGIADTLETGQDLSDLLASLLRIDVDRTEGDRAYAIPKDNPFVNTPHARPEIWAYGLRQVWKFSFDAAGRLWAGEVGQDLWESVHLIEKGGNYGWSVMEGTHPFRPERKKGPTPIQTPVLELPHWLARSLTGGYISQSDRLADLKSTYIYGDYDTGKVWSLRHEQGKVVQNRELVDTQLRIVAFAQDNAGEVYAVDFVGGQLHKLVPTPPEAAKADSDFPRKLSETGLFTSTKDNQPAPGLIPYSVNAPLWSDGGTKERFIALPGESQIEFDTLTYPSPAPGSEPGWRFPHDAVLVKTFSLDLEAGNPASRRRLETRILHFKHMPGTDEYGAEFWRGYTYVWNDEQTDATLLDADGLNRAFTIKDAAAPGGQREQVWRFPSRAECTLCHTMSAKYALGVNTLQMNKDHDYHGTLANQLATLAHLGVFTKPLPAPPEKLKSIVDYQDASQDLNLRARSYLHANCSHCHRKWGGGNAEFLLLASLPLNETGTLNMRPGQGKFDLNDPKLLVAGDPARSLVLHRMQKLGLGRMPHIASNLRDEAAITLIENWIKQLDPKSELKSNGLR